MYVDATTNTTSKVINIRTKKNMNSLPTLTVLKEDIREIKK